MLIGKGQSGKGKFPVEIAMFKMRKPRHRIPGDAHAVTRHTGLADVLLEQISLQNPGVDEDVYKRQANEKLPV